MVWKFNLYVFCDDKLFDVLMKQIWFLDIIFWIGLIFCYVLFFVGNMEFSLKDGYVQYEINVRNSFLGIILMYYIFLDYVLMEIVQVN